MTTQVILAVVLVVMAIVMLGDHSDKTTGLIFAGIVIVLTTVAVILANTWAKKK